MSEAEHKQAALHREEMYQRATNFGK